MNPVEELVGIIRENLDNTFGLIVALMLRDLLACNSESDLTACRTKWWGRKDGLLTIYQRELAKTFQC